MNVYYQNRKAVLSGSQVATGSSLDNIYDPMLELRADFPNGHIVIIGSYGNPVAVDSLCIGYTNAVTYKLMIPSGNTFSGIINGKITICDFNSDMFINAFILELECYEPQLYLGHLFLGKKIVLPRFAVEPDTGITLNSEALRSSGGQVFGMKRATLKNFGVKFNRLASDEYKLIKEYIEAVQNVEPHIIDPYQAAREDFPPMYATLNIKEVSLPKRNENGFYYGGSLAWQEAR